MERIKLLPMYWFGRLYVSADVAIISLIACFGKDTLSYRIIELSGPEGFWCVLALACIALLGVLDVLINDLLPELFHLKTVKRHRHFLLMGIAIGSLSVAGIVAMTVGLSVLHISLALPVFGATCMAVMDVYARGGRE